MSDTPRTDAQLLTVKDCSYVAPHPTGEYVHAEFARELERENAALRELVGSVPREVFLDNGETSQRALANYEAFNAARKEAKP